MKYAIVLVLVLVGCVGRITVPGVAIEWQAGDAVVCRGITGQQAEAIFIGDAVWLKGNCVWSGQMSSTAGEVAEGIIPSFFRWLGLL